jgi:hypothetical protein
MWDASFRQRELSGVAFRTDENYASSRLRERAVLRSRPRGAKRNLRLRQSADEILRLIDAAGSFVLRNLRIRAERARAADAAFGYLGRDDLLGRHTVLPPLLKCGQHVENVGSLAASAMIHAGNHEQSDRTRSL